VPRPDPNAFATFESRQKGGYARAAKLREQRELVEQIKLERLADGPTPRRRRNRTTRSTSNVYGLRDPYAPAYPVDPPAQTAPVAPARVAVEERPRPFDSGRYEW